MSWKTFNFMKPAGLEKEIEGEKLIFYPISMKALFKLRQVAGPVMEALTILLTRNDNDCATRAKSDKSGKVTEIDTEAIPTETAKLRTAERKDAMRKAVETLLDPGNSEVMAYLLGDSLKDSFDGVPMKEKVEFVEALPFGIAFQMCLALVEANKKVFGPFAEKAGDLLQKGMDAANLGQGLEEEEVTTG